MKKLLKYAAGSLYNVIIVTAILVIIVIFSINHHKRFDLTKDKKFSLDDKSIKVAENLKKEVHAYVFYAKGGNFRDRAKNLLDQYLYHSKKIQVSYLETTKNPLLAKDMELKNPNSLVLKTDKKKEVLTKIGEEETTNALIKVTQDKQVYVGFVAGHGERDIVATDGAGFSTAANSLKDENYKVETVNIASEKGIPDDMELLVICGPKTQYLDTEIEKIREYVDKGKSLMVMLEPSKDEKNVNLIALLKTWGIEVKDEIVIDQLGMQMFRNPFVAVVPINFYGKHPIVKNFKLQTFYLLARPLVLIVPPPENTKFAAIASTAPAPYSYAKAMNKAITEKDIKFVKDKDFPGPVRVAVAGSVENKGKKDEKGKNISSRVVVYGNVNFACNEFLLKQGNKNIFMNSVSWLTQQEELISIRKAQSKFAPLFLDDKQKAIMRTTVVIILPLVIILTGIIMLWRRR